MRLDEHCNVHITDSRNDDVSWFKYLRTYMALIDSRYFSLSLQWQTSDLAIEPEQLAKNDPPILTTRIT